MVGSTRHGRLGRSYRAGQRTLETRPRHACRAGATIEVDLRSHHTRGAHRDDHRNDDQPRARGPGAPSSPARPPASAARSPCSSPATAPRSSCTAATPSAASGSSRRSRPPAARRASSPRTSRTPSRSRGSPTRRATSTSSSTTPGSRCGARRPGSTLDDFDAMYAGNVRAPFQLVAALAPAMVERGAGSIINVSSMAGRIGLSGGAAYGATKAAVASLTQAWAAELQRRRGPGQRGRAGAGVHAPGGARSASTASARRRRMHRAAAAGGGRRDGRVPGLAARELRDRGDRRRRRRPDRDLAVRARRGAGSHLPAPPRSGIVWVVRLLLNIIWFVLAGLWMAIGYAFAALIMFVLIITIPFGIASLRIAMYALWPFGRTIVRHPSHGVALDDRQRDLVPARRVVARDRAPPHRHRAVPHDHRDPARAGELQAHPGLAARRSGARSSTSTRRAAAATTASGSTPRCRSSARAQKQVRTVSSTVVASSTTWIARHLSNVVHGCDGLSATSPRRAGPLPRGARPWRAGR